MTSLASPLGIVIMVLVVAIVGIGILVAVLIGAIGHLVLWIIGKKYGGHPDEGRAKRKKMEWMPPPPPLYSDHCSVCGAGADAPCDAGLHS